MKQWIAFFEKECMELVRSSKLLVLGILFVLFGIMNPAMAKLMPLIMEMAAESLEGSGLMITEVEVTALTSWEQFYKNVPIVMIVFLCMFSSSFTIEYQKGTLINVLTKGFARHKVVLSKAVVILLSWTAGYLVCFGITYGYNAFFWDNGIAEHVFFAAFCLYVLGVWLISLMVLASILALSSTTVALVTGGVFGVVYMLELIPKLKMYLPTSLMGAGSLLTGDGDVGKCTIAVMISLVLAVINMGVAVVVFNKKCI